MGNSEEKVFFYEREFYPFSNFSSFALEWEGTLYMTSEHAYQAQKFSDSEIIERIKNARSAYDVFKIAREHQNKVRYDWLDIRVSVMEKIIRAKVAQHPYVKQKLIESGDREIVEDSWKDDFWGWGSNKDGQNQLGKIWMKIREEIK
jgi:ribA/ribD-fused uncharacterized protein